MFCSGLAWSKTQSIKNYIHMSPQFISLNLSVILWYDHMTLQGSQNIVKTNKIIPTISFCYSPLTVFFFYFGFFFHQKINMNQQRKFIDNCRKSSAFLTILYHEMLGGFSRLLWCIIYWSYLGLLTYFSYGQQFQQ